MKTRFLNLLPLFFISIAIQAQVTFTSIPDDLELIPRNTQTTGNFTISGTCSYTGHSIHTKIMNVTSGSSTPVEDKVTSVNANGTFSVQHQIPAILAEYNVLIYRKNDATQVEVLERTVSNIVCGDVFIIDGQSNALTGIPDNDAIAQTASYRNTFCRGLGYNFYQATKPPPPNTPSPNDLLWSRPTTVWWDPGYTGAWALKLQNDLANSLQIPNCFINGAKSGSYISEHFASNTPSNPNQLNLNNPYDRLYWKLKQNDLTTSVKGIFWYQGESDGGLATCDAADYANRFDKLYNSWKQDYPNVKKIFVFQINTGCADNTQNHSLVRDIQRQLPLKYSDVELMSTIGSTASDRSSEGCHYTVAGYNKLADKIKPLVKKEIYGIAAPASSYPPKLLKAYFTSNTQICLEFGYNVYAQTPLTVNGATYDLKDFFFNENYAALSVTSLSVTANKLYLNLAANSPVPKAITYLPNNTYNNGGVYVGPWIVDATTNTVGALSFKDFPILPSNAYNNGFDLAFSNLSAELFAGWKVLPADKFVAGDFDGNGAQELLAIQSFDNNAWSTQLVYANNTWNWGWSNYGSAWIGGWHIAAADKYYVGNFDGLVGDELLIASGSAGSSWMALEKFQNGTWSVIWTNNGTSNNDLAICKNNLTIGDFDGNGKADIIGVVGNTTTMFNYINNNFVAGFISASPYHVLYPFRTNFKAGDFNGDGKSDLLGFNGSTATVFYYNTSVSGSWQTGESNNGGNTAFGGWALPALSNDNFLIGNIDTDAKDEIFCIQGGTPGAWATTVSTNTTGGFSGGWSNNGNGYIHDWAVSETGGSNTKYVLVKPTTAAKKYLVAMRLYSGCTNNFAVNMYQTNNASLNYRPTGIDEPKVSFYNNVTVYPNPATGEFKIAYSLSKGGEVVKVSLYNTVGQLVKETTVSSVQGMNEHAIDASNLAKGMYVIRIEKEGSFFTEKIAIQQ